MRFLAIVLCILAGCAGRLSSSYDIALAITDDTCAVAGSVSQDFIAEGAIRTWNLGNGSGMTISQARIEVPVDDDSIIYVYDYRLSPRDGGFYGQAMAVAKRGDGVCGVTYHVTGTNRSRMAFE